MHVILIPGLWLDGSSWDKVVPGPGAADTPSAATGTVMRPDTVQRYATEAGFNRFEVLPIDHDVWRFYRASASR